MRAGLASAADIGGCQRLRVLSQTVDQEKDGCGDMCFSCDVRFSLVRWCHLLQIPTAYQVRLRHQ